MTDAIIYNRVSTDEQNPELQLDECKKYVADRGWNLVQVFSEFKSAWKDESKRVEFNNMLKFVKERHADYIVVWNLDRFSRQPEEAVIKQVHDLALFGVKIVAVHGDVWSELVESLGHLREMGTIGVATFEFLERVIRALEYQRAYRESQIKSERIKSAVRRKDGRTESYKGNWWGRKPLPKQTRDKIWGLYNEGMSIRWIARTVKYYQKDRERFVSLGAVHKTIAEKRREKLGET